MLDTVMIFAAAAAVPLVVVALPYRANINAAFPLLNSTQISFKAVPPPSAELTANSFSGTDSKTPGGIGSCPYLPNPE